MIGAFSWTSEYTASEGDCVYYVKNGSDHILGLSLFTFGSEVDNKFSVYQVTGTASGTPAHGINDEEGDSPATTADLAISFGDAKVTGLEKGAEIFIKRCKEHSSTTHKLTHDSIVNEIIYLNSGMDIGIYVANAGDIEVCISGAWV